MACFLAPAVEAIVVTIVKKNIEKKEAARLASTPDSALAGNRAESGIPWSRKLGWLTNLLWGGIFLLAIEHIWHGEVVPWPPFLTAMNNPADVQPMLMEIVTVGGTMIVLVTIIWGVMVLAADYIYKRKSAAASATQED
jgi:hypothetical protein